MKARTILAIAAVLAVLTAVLIGSLGEDPDAKRSQLLGNVAPTFDLPNLVGEGNVSSSDLAGQVIIVNFWNSWCVPCQEELPDLQTFWDAHQDDGDVVMVGILRDDQPAAAVQAAREDEMDWTLVDDPDGEASIAFGTRGQPETFVIAPDGTVAGVQIGPVRVKDLEAMLATARS